MPALPAWAPATRLESPLEPLRLPASAIGAGGVIDLGGQCAVMIACSSVNFHLASGREQDTAISAFAGVLHSLTGPAQILVRGLRLDLTPFTASLRAGALALAHPALEEAAHAHADFLDELGQSRLVQRHIVLVLTASGTPHTAGRNLLARAEDTASRLGGLGVQARLCDGETAEDILRACLHPSPEPPPPDHGADTERIST